MDHLDRACRFPVSVKGVVVRKRRVILLRNEREEWELPGGKLELGETPERCVVREIDEELQLRVRAHRLLDLWVYAIPLQRPVLIATYGCEELEPRQAVLGAEHNRCGWFSLADVEFLPMPTGYKTSISTWLSILSQPSLE